MSGASAAPTEVNSQVVDGIKTFIGELAEMLNQRLPGIEDQCRKINTLLRQEPRAAALLTEEDIGNFMKVHYNIAHVEFATPKSSSKGKAAIKKLASEEIKDLII